MRTLIKNKQRMWYALKGTERIPVYDYYVDSDSVKHPIETGESRIPYLEPVMFKGNISTSGSDAKNEEYGLNLADYEALLIVDKNSIPITETSLIWHNTEPQYNEDGTVDEHSADYKVVKVSPSLNVDKYVLKRLVK